MEIKATVNCRSKTSNNLYKVALSTVRFNRSVRTSYDHHVRSVSLNELHRASWSIDSRVSKS